MNDYNVDTSGRFPIKAWTKGVQVEDVAMEQLRNLASLPFIHKHIAVMADCHWGIGGPIGSVIATKGAIMQLTRAMALDHGPAGVRVNCICPGWIETPMSLPYLTENPGSRRFGEQIAPLGRIGKPEDVAEVALFLASDESRFVTGSAYGVDGGWTAGMASAIALV